MAVLPPHEKKSSAAISAHDWFTAVCRHKKLGKSLPAIRMAGTLLRWVNADLCLWPSQVHIGTTIGKTRAKVSAAIRELEKAKAIKQKPLSELSDDERAKIGVSYSRRKVIYLRKFWAYEVMEGADGKKDGMPERLAKGLKNWKKKNGANSHPNDGLSPTQDNNMLPVSGDNNVARTRDTKLEDKQEVTRDTGSRKGKEDNKQSLYSTVPLSNPSSIKEFIHRESIRLGLSSEARRSIEYRAESEGWDTADAQDYLKKFGGTNGSTSAA